MITRRRILVAATTAAALAIWPRRMVWPSAAIIEITMMGRADGSRTWFDPVGLLIQPGQTIRWTNVDPGNAHSATAYHPMIGERPLRMPDQAKPWNSDLLLPDESFAVTLTVPGVYDYYCIPHEESGMVGRIVVSDGSDLADPTPGGDLPAAALAAFPPVRRILAERIIAGTDKPKAGQHGTGRHD